jgi:hypothetical protein
VQHLRDWMTSQETSTRSTHVGLKHPLLSLSASDALAAWGNDDTLFVQAHRPLSKSIDGSHPQMCGSDGGDSDGRRGWLSRALAAGGELRGAGHRRARRGAAGRGALGLHPTEDEIAMAAAMISTHGGSR